MISPTSYFNQAVLNLFQIWQALLGLTCVAEWEGAGAWRYQATKSKGVGRG